MKRRVKQWIAFLLTFMMIFSTGIVAVQAAENTEGTNQEVSVKPELSSKTQDTVVLKAQDGYSYAIKEADKWKWAEDKQYDKNAKTVTFSGLKAGTEYIFASGTSKTETVKDADTLKVTTENAVVQEEKKEPAKEAAPAEPQPQKQTKQENQQQPKQEEQTQPQEQPKQEEQTQPQEQPKQGEQVQPQEQPKQGEQTQPQEQPKQEEQVQPQEQPKQVSKPVGTKEEVEQQNNKPAVFANNGPQANNTPTKLSTPNKPNLVEATDKSLTVTTGDNADAKPKYNYKLTEKSGQGSETEIRGIDAVNSALFENLKPDTEYNISIMAVGYTADDGTVYENSDWSEPLTAKTLKAAAEAVSAPELEKKTDTTVQLKSVEGVQYACIVDNAQLTENVWTDSNLFEKLIPGKTYEFVARKAFNAAEQMPSIISKPLEVTTLKAAAEAPPAPEYITRSTDSISLKAVDGQEYALLQDGKPGKWQTSGTFAGLKSNTVYSFVTRKTYNPDEALESKVSAPTKVKTVISFSGSSVSGIKENGVYDKNAVLNITAAGNGQDNSNPSIQDTRWIPESWGWSQEKGTWTKSPYTAKMTLKKSGNAELKVVFQLEEYTGSGWTAMKADTKSITVHFRVKEEYTITASVGSGGKISPTGKVKVMEGNDRTFTITPNKGYNISQVKVDGKAVTVKNNKYTFSEVKENHTISVTFKKAVTSNKKTSPKTGDENNIAGLLALLAISAAAAGGVVYAGRRKKKQ